MTARPSSSRWAIWAFAAALLLKSAMPWLASTSAAIQGTSLVEVCTVYGVSLVPLDGGSHEPLPDHHAAHDDSHCPLSALAVLATLDPPTVVASAHWRWQSVPPAACRSPKAPDPCAAWVARRKHGPPPVA